MKILKLAGILLALVIITGLLLAGCARSPAPPSPSGPALPTAAAVVIMPAVFAAGDQFQVAGSGFAPGEAVEIAILNATPEKNIYFGGGFRASDTGAFFAPVLPRDDYAAVVDKGGSALMLPRLSPGVYTLTVKGLNGSMATAPLVIIEKAK